ncbi:MAG TPA: conjugal transfer protein [Streptosporangiaceae bacterium]|nr:conjugal transfer protein [Streptosporangiaceae bacterium]
MARRALLDRSAEFTVDDQVPPPSQPHPVRPDQAASPWRGAGGRWLIWLARAVAWAVLLLIGYRGVVAIIEGPAPRSVPTGPVAAPSESTQFPVTSAEAYALDFGDVYLNLNPASSAARSRDLAAFLPPGASGAAGWNGSGTQRMLDEQVAGISITGSHSAVVTLLAQLSNGRLIELGVPVYANAGRMSVQGLPAWLPGPGKATPPAGSQTSDQATETALQTQLPAFFQAFATGDQGTLARFTAPGARLTGLHSDVTFGGIDSVYAPAGGATRQVSVTVTWHLPAPGTASSAAAGGAPAALQMTYQMTVVRQGGSWDVRSIGASTQPLAQGPP